MEEDKKTIQKEDSLEFLQEQYEQAIQQVSFWQSRAWYLKGQIDMLNRLKNNPKIDTMKEEEK